MSSPVLKTLVVLLLVGASGAAAEEVDRTFEKRFDVEPGARLEIEHGDGEVVIQPWEEAAIEIEVRYRVEITRVGVGRDPDLEVRFDQSGDVVRVVGVEKAVGGVGFFSTNELEYVYRVQAPPWVELDLSGDDGGVEVEGWRAAIRIHNDDGDVRLSDVHGSLRLRAEDGDVEIVGSSGELDLEAEDGDVTIRDSRSERARIDVEDGRLRMERCSGSFEISSDDGAVELTGLSARRVDVRGNDGRVSIGVAKALGELDLDVRTGDGDVVLELGAGVSGAFTLFTSDGGVRVEAAARDLEKSRRRATGTLGDGAGQIRVSTGDGTITLRQSE